MIKALDINWLPRPEPATRSRLQQDMLDEKRRNMRQPEPDDEGEIRRAERWRERRDKNGVTPERLRDEDRLVVRFYDRNGQVVSSGMQPFNELCEVLRLGREERMKVATDIKFKGVYQRVHTVPPHFAESVIFELKCPDFEWRRRGRKGRHPKF
jgi:hypothetical protein